jgi:hypothetical protein
MSMRCFITPQLFVQQEPFVMVAFMVCDMATHHFATLIAIAQINVESCHCAAFLALHKGVIRAFSFCLTFSIPGHFSQQHLP